MLAKLNLKPNHHADKLNNDNILVAEKETAFITVKVSKAAPKSRLLAK